MSEAADAFHLEERVRPLTSDEDVQVEEEQRRFRRSAKKYFARRRRNAIVIPIVAGGVMALGGVLVGGGKVAAIAGAIGGVFGSLMGRGKNPLDDLYESGRSVWDPAEGKKWKTREIVVRAKSIVAVTGEEGDDTSYLLFEIPGEDWLFVDQQWLPDDWSSLKEIAHTEVTLTALHPRGPVLSVETSEDPIPSRQIEERWSPREELWRGAGDGRVPESELPTSLRISAD